ncbi:hypothetical protein M0813_02479 [Anaeramoeba flamelloides]|uniref:B box-type domain-containing protein n=1 Tax=Anaeramoeba flamelloides TaxID=1746091 RepID=A0ABQ8YDI9_9EUKA|nr:hypothetical protein M0813_02479 [Anaeramoeba flamelloides]
MKSENFALPKNQYDPVNEESAQLNYQTVATEFERLYQERNSKKTSHQNEFQIKKRCKIHNHEKRTLYCLFCSMYCCNKCKTLLHQGHTIQSLESRKIEIEKEFETYQDKLQHRLYHEKKQFQILCYNLEENKTRQKKKIRKLSNEFDKLQGMLTVRKKEIVEKLNLIKDTKQKELQKYNKKQKELFRGITVLKEQICSLDQFKQNHQIKYISNSNSLLKNDLFLNLQDLELFQDVPKICCSYNLDIGKQLKMISNIIGNTEYDTQATEIEITKNIEAKKKFRFIIKLFSDEKEVILPKKMPQFELKIISSKGKIVKSKIEINKYSLKKIFYGNSLIKKPGLYFFEVKIDNICIRNNGEQYFQFRSTPRYSYQNSIIKFPKIVTPNQEIVLKIDLKDKDNKPIKIDYNINFDVKIYTKTKNIFINEIKIHRSVKNRLNISNNKLMDEKKQENTDKKLKPENIIYIGKTRINKIGLFKIVINIDKKKFNTKKLIIRTVFQTVKLNKYPYILTKSPLNLKIFKNFTNLPKFNQKLSFIVNKMKKKCKLTYYISDNNFSGKEYYHFKFKIKKIQANHFCIGIAPDIPNFQILIQKTLFFDCSQGTLITPNQLTNYGSKISNDDIVSMHIDLKSKNQNIQFGIDPKGVFWRQRLSPLPMGIAYDRVPKKFRVVLLLFNNVDKFECLKMYGTPICFSNILI